MSAANESVVPALNPFQAELRILRTHRHNVLLQGPPACTNVVLSQLQPHIRQPIMWHEAPQPLHLPSGEAGTLILKEVGALSGDDQQRLLGWMVDIRSLTRTRIVSTTEAPLFALVENGRFNDTLYYRLNVLLLPIGSRLSPDGPDVA